MHKKLHIWQVTREITPFAEAGGIKDVVYGLSKALVDDSHHVTVILPMYKFLLQYKTEKPELNLIIDFSNEIYDVKVYKYIYDSIRIFFVSASCYSDKELVYTYSRNEEENNPQTKSGNGHKDSHLMNLVLQRSALEIAYRLNEKPDIYHLHDGHSGFLPAIMKHTQKYVSFFSDTACLLTIHNAGIIYQQNIVDIDEALKLTGLSADVLNQCKIEYGYSPIYCSAKFGHVNTVSKEYAREIMSGIDHNSGVLGHILKSEKIHLWGITNGIDKNQYTNPIFRHTLKPDPSSKSLKWKKEYKSTLLSYLDTIKEENFVFGSLIKNVNTPLITMQSRITYQKGIDIFFESLKTLIVDFPSVNFLVVGEGEKVYETALSDLAINSENLCFIRKYDKILSQNLFAAGDFFVIPSRWEPCGLTDFIAQLFGNIPIVHKTGGLTKTKNGVNGFSYKPNNPKSLGLKIEKAIKLYQNDSSILYHMRENAVNLIDEKYTWEKVLAKGYLPLYKKISQS